MGDEERCTEWPPLTRFYEPTKLRNVPVDSKLQNHEKFKVKRRFEVGKWDKKLEIHNDTSPNTVQRRMHQVCRWSLATKAQNEQCVFEFLQYFLHKYREFRKNFLIERALKRNQRENKVNLKNV